MVVAQSQFWIFSLALYGADRVKDNCLHLQDKFGADVNLILWCCYCAWDLGRICETPEIEAIDARLKQWRDEMLIPLRKLRRNARSDKGVYEALKAAEIEAERYAQGLIIKNALSTQSTMSRTSGTRLSFAHQSLRNYLVGYLGVQDGKVSDVITVLLSGLNRVSDEHQSPTV